MAMAMASSSAYPVAHCPSSSLSKQQLLTKLQSTRGCRFDTRTSALSRNVELKFGTSVALFNSTEEKSSMRSILVAAGDDVMGENASPEGPSVNESPESGISSLRSESEILKRKKKREELRRKRLVRKRHLRKKGRWPPSKVAKNKNI